VHVGKGLPTYFSANGGSHPQVRIHPDISPVDRLRRSPDESGPAGVITASTHIAPKWNARIHGKRTTKQRTSLPPRHEILWIAPNAKIAKPRQTLV